MTSRRSSGSMRADSAVEPTRSENITVTWRRSARSSGGRVEGTGRGRYVGWRSLSSHRRAAQRWHRGACGGARDAATPSSFRSSAVRLGRTVSSISFSRNAASYCPRPRLRSQTTTSMMTPLWVATGTSLTLASKAHSAKRNHTTTTRALRRNWRGRLGFDCPAPPTASGRWRKCAVPRLSSAAAPLIALLGVGDAAQWQVRKASSACGSSSDRAWARFRRGCHSAPPPRGSVRAAATA